MLILTVENKPKNTDLISLVVEEIASEVEAGREPPKSAEQLEDLFYSILSFKEYKNPDFFFEQMHYLEEFNSASITLQIGQYYEIIMPLHWSILCTDMESVQSIPLYEVSGREFAVFCLNPLDGYSPQFHPLRTSTIYPNTTWTAPPVGEKDMLVVPLGENQRIGQGIKRGPVCAMFSPSKFEVNRPISDIW